MSDRREGQASDADDDPVPIFGTWRGIYTAVVVCALLFMGFVAVFSNWPY
jgi:hypothetical protein